MAIDIVINFTSFETRIAFLENGRVNKVLIERESEDLTKHLTVA